MRELVFVYGTLKKNHSNHHVIKEARYMGPDTTSPSYDMFTCGSFPGIVKGGKTAIFGEVYAVPDLKRLDSLEGYPSFYNREQIDTRYGKAWVYYLEKRPIHWDKVDGGVWR